MAAQYSKEEDAQWVESKRLEEARRIGMGLPNGPGMMAPPRPRPQGAPKSGAPRSAPEIVGSPSGPVRTSSTIPPVPGGYARPAKRQLPITGLVEAKDVLDPKAHGAAAQVGAGGGADIAEDATVAEAVNQGFAGGLIGGLSAASPLGAIAHVADEMETSEAARIEGVAARMERFPELRGVEVPTGNAAKFPELTEQAPRPDAQQPEQDGGYQR